MGSLHKFDEKYNSSKKESNYDVWKMCKLSHRENSDNVLGKINWSPSNDLFFLIELAEVVGLSEVEADYWEYSLVINDDNYSEIFFNT